MEHLLQFLKCIADETRLKILKILLEGQFCVCELTDILEKSQPCISQHLRRFKELNLVIEERREQWAYFSINRPVYERYLQILQGLAHESYANLGMEEAEAKIMLSKEDNLCSKKSSINCSNRGGD